MEYTICPAEIRHIDSLEALEQSCFSLPWTRDQLVSQLPDEQHVFLVADSGNGQVLGYVGMMAVLDEGYISNVAVSPDHRRKGIADALMRALLCEADRRSLSFVTLEVREHNEAAIKLYEKWGFRPVGKRKNYYERPAEDAILMTTFLK